MVALRESPPMFVCGEDGGQVPMVTCEDCGWSGFAGSPERGEVDEAARERDQGGWWPDPRFHYGDLHTELVCRSWQRGGRPSLGR